MLERNPEFNRREWLIEASQAGLFTVPDRLTEQWLLAKRCLEATHRTAEIDLVGPARASFRDAVAAAAQSQTVPFPEAAGIPEAEQGQRAVELKVAALAEATTHAQGAFVALCADLSDTIITAHLRPALAELLTQVRPAATAVKPFAGNLEALLTAPAKARDAWLTLASLGERYAALRRARSLLARGYPWQHDNTGRYGEFRNVDVIFPENNAHHPPNGRPIAPPWPTTSTRDRLIWMATSEPAPETWMPTPAEEDARFYQVHRDAIERVKHARLVAAGGHAPVGGS